MPPITVETETIYYYPAPKENITVNIVKQDKSEPPSAKYWRKYSNSPVPLLTPSPSYLPLSSYDPNPALSGETALKLYGPDFIKGISSGLKDTTRPGKASDSDISSTQSKTKSPASRLDREMNELDGKINDYFKNYPREIKFSYYYPPAGSSDYYYTPNSGSSYDYLNAYYSTAA